MQVYPLCTALHLLNVFLLIRIYPMWSLLHYIYTILHSIYNICILSENITYIFVRDWEKGKEKTFANLSVLFRRGCKYSLFLPAMYVNWVDPESPKQENDLKIPNHMRSFNNYVIFYLYYNYKVNDLTGKFSFSNIYHAHCIIAWIARSNGFLFNKTVYSRVQHMWRVNEEK
jgi:hypothetical protein